MARSINLNRSQALRELRREADEPLRFQARWKFQLPFRTLEWKTYECVREVRPCNPRVVGFGRD
ncbi:MAG: hypothetical protein NZ954_04760 [Thermofilaceae archaeon]|nr:hypothetical protein [Thermofilaceae archaeon]MDW8004227.1 hypothetical protein [Thermofilaceae archaeon]